MIIKPTMTLECKHCNERLDPDAVLEVYQLHFQVIHDQDEVELNLVAVCTCGLTMKFDQTVQVGGTKKVRDLFHCACGNKGSIERKR